MVFSSPLFLFVFLPLVLGLHLLAPRPLRNAVLLLASLLFYAWGETDYVAVMLVSILANYLFALWIERDRRASRGRTAVACAIVFNLALLSYFKYAVWACENVAALCRGIGLSTAWLGRVPDIHLPLGISFYTFHAMSAVIDVHRGDARAGRNPLDFALYIACFPQLVAGPIIRYHDVADQIRERTVTFSGFAYGVRRFIVGLAKKALLANTIAPMVDESFAVHPGELSCAAAWMAMVGWGFQVYYDFSGYSDMAIGLGRIFGFRYRENFDHPFVSKSITEYWRRWHISLTTWFRDYVYIPMGGNRRGAARTYFNLVVVFVLVGLWHGAAWFYIVFGLYHGSLMILERLSFGRWLARTPAILQHAYFWFVLNLGWTIFRGESLTYTRQVLPVMFDPFPSVEPRYHADLFLDNARVLALVAGVVCSLPWIEWADRWRARSAARGLALPRAPSRGLATGLELASTAALVLVFLASVLFVSAGTYNPFIYFRF
jgi:alginate O-acetyltransferase complex protein AlgI